MKLASNENPLSGPGYACLLEENERLVKVLRRLAEEGAA